jgi:hypothetical protein
VWGSALHANEWMVSFLLGRGTRLDELQGCCGRGDEKEPFSCRESNPIRPTLSLVIMLTDVQPLA